MAEERRRIKLPHQFFEDSKSMIGKVKHAILESYLGAWFAKLSQNQWRTKGVNRSTQNPEYSRLVYIDGFAGSGSYGSDELGSPTLTYRLALDHRSIPEDGPEIVLIFIEKDPRNCIELLHNLQTMRLERYNAKNASIVRYMVIQGDFVSAMQYILSNKFELPEDSMDKIYRAPQEERSVEDMRSMIVEQWQYQTHRFITSQTPLFVFVDPFGYNGKMMPMVLMKAIFASSRKAEIFVNIMTGHAQRFYKLDSRTRPLNLLTGFDEEDASWKPAVLQGTTTEEKTKFFLDHYFKTLSLGFRRKPYCPRFEMRDERNKLIYHLCFACQHPKSLDSMKRAMTNMTHQEGEFKFSGFIEIKGDDRPALDMPKVVRDVVINEFSGRGYVSSEEINEFLLHDTMFVQKYRVQLKKLLQKYRVGNKTTRKFDEMCYSFANIIDSSCDEADQVNDNDDNATSLNDRVPVRRRRRRVERRANNVLHKAKEWKLKRLNY